MSEDRIQERLKKTRCLDQHGNIVLRGLYKPRTGELLVNNNEIKRASLEYCIEKLRTDSPDKDIAALVKERKEKHLKIINDKSGEGFEVSLEKFDIVLVKFGTKETKIYHFLLKTVDKYKKAIFNIYEKIIEGREVHDSFRKTFLILI